MKATVICGSCEIFAMVAVGAACQTVDCGYRCAPCLP